MIGQTLGHYRVVGKLGEGGMGEVYCAQDTKLRRDVALKVLPETFARDSGRMARFEREARVLASLNHPNIAAIYGLEEDALVMELVEGETLRGPVALEKAIGYARQMAEALEYAHEKGIVHRDLTLANVKVTPDGMVVGARMGTRPKDPPHFCARRGFGGRVDPGQQVRRLLLHQARRRGEPVRHSGGRSRRDDQADREK